MSARQPVIRPAVRALLVDESEQILLLRGTVPTTGAPFWFAPGGGIEPGESAPAALGRELSEELGLIGVVGSEVWT